MCYCAGVTSRVKAVTSILLTDSLAIGKPKMALDLQDFDVLDWIKDDDDLASLLNDALETGEEAYIAAVLSDIERAKNLTVDTDLTVMGRMVRAAEAIGTQLRVSPPVVDGGREAA